MKKRKIVAACVLVALIVAYVASYSAIRNYRLSREYVGSRLVFESKEQASEWTKLFNEQQAELPLIYDDSETLYVLYWPAIRIDSTISGRRIDSPFEAMTYATPKKK